MGRRFPVWLKIMKSMILKQGQSRYRWIVSWIFIHKSNCRMANIRLFVYSESKPQDMSVWTWPQLININRFIFLFTERFSQLSALYLYFFPVRPQSVKIQRKETYLTERQKVRIVCEVKVFICKLGEKNVWFEGAGQRASCSNSMVSWGISAG